MMETMMTAVRRVCFGLAALLFLNAIFSPLYGGGKIGPEGRVTAIRVPNGGEAVEAKTSPNGTIHLLYNSNDIPYYVKSTDHGATFSSPIPAVGKESRKPALVFFGSAMAVG